MNSYKIIFSGSVNAGKTTAFESISDITPITTEAKSISHIPLFAVDARNRSDVVMWVEALLSLAESAQLHNDRG